MSAGDRWELREFLGSWSSGVPAAPPTIDRREERLQKILSAAGVVSRRAAERLIIDGRVSVNGTPVLELGTKADPRDDTVRVDGSRIATADRAPLHPGQQAGGHGDHALRSGAAPDGDHADPARSRLPLPRRPARLRHRGPAAPDQRRRAGGAAHASPSRSAEGLSGARARRAGRARHRAAGARHPARRPTHGAGRRPPAQAARHAARRATTHRSRSRSAKGATDRCGACAKPSAIRWWRWRACSSVRCAIRG